jgi:hypothetical protein
MPLVSIAVAAVAWVSLFSAVQVTSAADCPCGYFDSTTSELWTDAIFTYFNETDASSDIVAAPAISPYLQGQDSAGDTGNGTEDWSIIGGQVDAWEDAFGATYRSAVLLNNTQIQESELQMYVQPAEMKNRIVYGAECACLSSLEPSDRLPFFLALVLTLSASFLPLQSSLEDATFCTAPFERP